MMLGLLLARAGGEGLVLEKHRDFLRDLPGRTLHPSTLQVMHELGLLEACLARPHQEVRELRGIIGDSEIRLADFTHLPTRCRFIALMPQWDFLDFLAEAGARLPRFHLRMEAECTDLIEEPGRVVGVCAHTPEGAVEIRADLVVGADGRHSVVRERAGLDIINLGAPIDVLWMRVSKSPSDPGQSAGRLNYGRMLVMLDRGDYWQCAFVIRKGGFDTIRERGLAGFRDEIVRIAPFLRDRVVELREWDDVKLLTVTVDRLRRWWRPGFLCIGDCAHAMSPVGGVGINLAIQDAVAAANLLAQPLFRGTVTDSVLHAVQKRREFPTRMTQGFQVFAHKRFIDPALRHRTSLRRLPLPLKLLKQFPVLRRIPARMLGLGFRPEHIQTPDANRNRRAS